MTNNFELTNQENEMNGEDDMSDAILRLKESRDNYMNDIQKRGVMFGKNWAKKKASWEELKNLARFVEEVGCPEDLDELADAITRGNSEFDGFSDECINDPVYIDGLIDGALEVLKQANEEI